MSRELYSERTGQARALNTRDFMKLIWAQYETMRRDRFFGPGLSGDTFLAAADESPVSEAALIRRFKVSGLRSELRSGGSHPPGYVTEDVALLFDVIEYLHNEVTPETKRVELRQRLNPDLALYTPSMEMLENGQIVEKVPDELDPLVSEPVRDGVPKPLADPLRHAIEQYRRRGATEQDKRAALKQLADVLEPLRSDIDEHILPADEQALFLVANKFFLRHNDRSQKRNYDGRWLDWVFYVYVATARALLSVLDDQELRERVYDEPDENGGLPF